jgi:hypothetical protein
LQKLGIKVAKKTNWKANAMIFTTPHLPN